VNWRASRQLCLVLIFALAPLLGQAESFFQMEAGLGAANTKDIGDGTWVQYHVPHAESLTTPVFLIGVTGAITPSLRYHLDYTYIGTFTAGCDCVSDADYAALRYNGSRMHFAGQGHIQGISLTLEPHVRWAGLTWGLEAGPFLFWSTWHEAVSDGEHVRHNPVPQWGWVAGVSASRGPLSLRYRYYASPQSWNPYPSLASGTHMILLTWRFQ
jgi:hypothetical protein